MLAARHRCLKFPTGNQIFYDVSFFPVSNQAVGGPGPGETGYREKEVILDHQDSVYRPCSPQAYVGRVLCCPYFRIEYGARIVAVKISVQRFAARIGMVLPDYS